jgi:transcriptional regulator with XRE-family HTH domain
MTNARDEELLKAFGNYVKQKRLARNLTQEELASLAGIETRQFGRIERGEVNCTLSSIHNLSKALKVKLPDMLKFNFDN